MARYYRSYRRPIKKTTRPTNKVIRAANATLPARTTASGYIYTATDPLTVMNIKLDTGAVADIDVAAGVTIAYCLVHVREGYNANNITYPALSDDMYNPTNDVIISGVLTDSSIEDHKYARIGRKMKPGDRLVLLYFLEAATGTANVSFEINFTTLH